MPIRPRRQRFISSRSHLRGMKKVNVVVRISRREQPRGGPAFVACATTRTAGWGQRAMHSNCAIGKNPRVVASRALHKLATKVGKRSGAFAEFSGYSRKNRKSRRGRRAMKRRY